MATCDECGGVLIPTEHEFTCSDCGLVVSDLLIVPTQQIVDYCSARRHTDNNWGEVLSYGINVGSNPIKTFRRLSIFDKNCLNYQKYCMRIGEILEIPKSNVLEGIFYRLYKKYHRKYWPGPIIFGALKIYCQQKKYVFPDRRSVLFLIQSFYLAIPTYQIINLEQELQLISTPVQDKLNIYLNQFFSKYPDAVLLQLCEKYKTRIMKIPAAPKTLAASLVWGCCKRIQLSLCKAKIADFFKIDIQSIHKW